MDFKLFGRQQDLGRDLRAFVARRVAFAFDRFQDDVLSVMVHLDDRQPGDEESLFHCSLVVVTSNGDVLESRADAMDPEPAIGGGIDRMVATVGAWKKAQAVKNRQLELQRS